MGGIGSAKRAVSVCASRRAHDASSAFHGTAGLALTELTEIFGMKRMMRLGLCGVALAVVGCATAREGEETQSTAQPILDIGSSIIPPTNAALRLYGSAAGGEGYSYPYTAFPSNSERASDVIPNHCWGNLGVGPQGQISHLTFAYKKAYARHACQGPNDPTYAYPCMVELRAYMVLPPRHRFDSGAKEPVAIFFHGGAWQGGTPMTYLHAANHLASLGIPSVSFQYRIASTHDRVQRLGYDDYVSREESTMDAKSAVRWIRKYAEHFSFDPDNIIALGGSAGGHLALATALSAPSISDEPPGSLDATIPAHANWLIPLFPVSHPTIRGLNGSSEFPLERARLIDPFEYVSRATSTKGMFIVTGDKDVHPLTPVVDQVAMVNAYNGVRPGRGELALIHGGAHDFIQLPDGPKTTDGETTYANGFETGMASIDDYLVRQKLMPDWSGRQTSTDRIRWFQYVMDPSYSSIRYGYDQRLCGGDRGVYNRYAFHGFNLGSQEPAVSTVGGQTFLAWNVSPGGLW